MNKDAQKKKKHWQVLNYVDKEEKPWKQQKTQKGTMDAKLSADLKQSKKGINCDRQCIYILYYSILFYTILHGTPSTYPTGLPAALIARHLLSNRVIWRNHSHNSSTNRQQLPLAGCSVFYLVTLPWWLQIDNIKSSSRQQSYIYPNSSLEHLSLISERIEHLRCQLSAKWPSETFHSRYLTNIISLTLLFFPSLFYFPFESKYFDWIFSKINQ